MQTGLFICDLDGVILASEPLHTIIHGRLFH